MRLNEIFDTKITDRKISGKFDKEKLERNKMEQLFSTDSGSFGWVKPDSDPFMVKKRPHKIRDNLSDDAYYTYIKTVVDDKLAHSNPYFPRVYDIKTFKDSNNKQLYSIKLEKLFKLDEISIKELKMLLNRCFKNLDELTKQIYKVTSFNDEKALYYIIIEKYINNINNLKDDNLIKAINIIETIRRSGYNEFNWDLHSGNLMARRTSKGPQLVIIDPLY